MYKNFLKRIIDFTIALIALLIIWPILLVITIWLHFANKGAGAFFTQERPDKDGKIFKVIKYKTMTDESDFIIATGPQSDVVPFLSITDLFAFPSYREGFGLSLMEAGAMGVPSVASNIPGCNEVVIDGKTGILIPSHSSQAIIESIENLYNDKELLNYLKSNCRNSIIERYEQKKLWQYYKEHYLRKTI